MPDGMTIDTEGMLWVAIHMGARVVRVDPAAAQVCGTHPPWSRMGRGATARLVPPAPLAIPPSLRMHTPVLESANPRMDSECASGCTRSTARATAPSLGRPTPAVVKQDKSSGGSVDTTKTRSGPQRVRMSSGERPVGAAKGKQSDTEALCQTPPNVLYVHPLCHFQGQSWKAQLRDRVKHGGDVSSLLYATPPPPIEVGRRPLGGGGGGALEGGVQGGAMGGGGGWMGGGFKEGRWWGGGGGGGWEGQLGGGSKLGGGVQVGPLGLGGGGGHRLPLPSLALNLTIQSP